MDLSSYPKGADLSKIPALDPPPGILSNFTDPASRANVTIIPCAGIVAVTILVVFLRMYTKIYITHSTGWDDCKYLLQHQVSFINGNLPDVCVFVTVGNRYVDVSTNLPLLSFSPLPTLDFSWTVSVDFLCSIFTAKKGSISARIWRPSMGYICRPTKFAPGKGMAIRIC